jgi:hypothetical protein
VSEAIETFFKDFETYSNQDDADRLTSQYADVFMAADPAGARVAQAAELRAFIPKRKQLFKSAGYQSTTLVSLHETKLDDHYVMVKTQWRMQFEPGNARAEEIDLASTFILHTSGEALKIVFYLTHHNIMTVLQDRGLLPPGKP